MQKKIELSLLILLFTSLTIYGQHEVQIYDSASVRNNTNIISFRDTLSVVTYISTKNNKLKLTQTDTATKKNKQLLFSPNIITQWGIGFDYKWLGVKLSFALPFMNRDNDKYGKTKQFDMQSQFYLKKFIIDAYLATYKGFYIENPQDFITNWDNKNPYPTRSDIATSLIGASVSYTMNHEKFSYKASFTQTEWQTKSAGSWMAGGYISLFNMSADSSIATVPYNTIFTDTSDIKKAGIIAIGASFGYAYTLVIKKRFYTTLALVPGLGFQTYKLENQNPSLNVEKSTLSARIQARLAIGYNGKKYYWGLMATGDQYPVKNAKTSNFAYSAGSARIFLGRRIAADKFLKKHGLDIK